MNIKALMHKKKLLHTLRTSGPYLVMFCVPLLALFFVFFRSDIARWLWNIGPYERTVLFISPDDPELLVLVGSYHFSSASYDIKRATELFLDAIAQDERAPYAHYQLARIYFIGSQFALARTEINKEMSYNPKNPRNYYMSGLIAGYAKDYDLAIAHFTKFTELVPMSWAGHNDLAWVYFAKGDYANVKRVAERGLAADPNNPWLMNSLGLALMNMGDKEGAKAQFERALRYMKHKTPEAWGRSYPGNDPGIYKEGLNASVSSIEANLKLVSGTTSRAR